MSLTKSMNRIALAAHSLFRMVVLLGLAIATVRFAIGYFGKRKWSSMDGALNHATPVLVDMQWASGIFLYTLRKTWAHPNLSVSVLHPATMTLSVVVSRIFWWRVLRYPLTERVPVTTETGDITSIPEDGVRFRDGMLGNLGTFGVIALGIYFVIGRLNIFTGSGD